jgi:hypothetical protein
MSYAGDFEDIGGDLAMQDYLIEVRADLAQERAERKYKLIGKYIIASDGKKRQLYLQDRRISKDSFWTKYLENAISFNNKQSALAESKKLKYNKPRVYLVTRNYELELVN